MTVFSQVNPGTYQVTIQASGFAAASSAPTLIEVGRNVALNFSLHPASSSQTIEVTAKQGLLSLDNPNTTTTIDSETIKSLPNPGQDLTYLAQFAQGALMNTAGSSSDAKAAGGYGNVEFNGLPATSNGYILGGYDSNDPWLGLNIGLSTSLVIGLDAVQEATVNTNFFSVEGVKLSIDRPAVQCIQSSEFRVAQYGSGRRARLGHCAIRDVAKHDFSSHRST